MIDALKTLEEAAEIALRIARDAEQTASVRLQGVAAATRAATALVGARATQSQQQGQDLLWATRTLQRAQSPAQCVSGPVATIDALRLQRAEHIMVTHQPKQETPKW